MSKVKITIPLVIELDYLSEDEQERQEEIKMAVKMLLDKIDK